MNPPRTRSRWLGASASPGASRSVGVKSVVHRMTGHRIHRPRRRTAISARSTAAAALAAPATLDVVRRLACVLAVVFVTTGACVAGGGGGDGDTDAEASAPTATAEPPPPTVVPTPFPTVDDVPDAQPGVEGTAADRVDQIVDWLNGAPLDEEMYADAFSAEFIAELPFDVYLATLEQVGAGGPWAIDRVELATPDAQRVVIVNEARDRAWSLELGVDDDGLVAGAVLSPASVAPRLPAVGFADAVAQLEELGTLRFLIAAPDNAQCNVLANKADSEYAPIGSMFKLYVLGALVEAIRAGDIAWDDAVVVRDELDSLPSGVTQEDPPGTELTVRELADRMITISDNTATDHLIDLVGRGAVEDVQRVMGHREPGRNQPFLTTREAFLLKLSGDDLAEQYIAADEEGRRQLLAGPVAALALPPVEEAVGAFAAPRFPTDIEWFASPQDLCRAFDWLMRDATAREILTTSPLSPNTDLWLELGFKGGGERGVVATGWWMRTANNQVFVVIVSLVDEEERLEEAAAIDLMVVLRDSTLTLSAG